MAGRDGTAPCSLQQAPGPCLAAGTRLWAPSPRPAPKGPRSSTACRAVTPLPLQNPPPRNGTQETCGSQPPAEAGRLRGILGRGCDGTCAIEWAWCSGTWFSGGLGRVRLMVLLYDLKGLFQPKWFWDSSSLHLGAIFWLSDGCGHGGGQRHRGRPTAWVCSVQEQDPAKTPGEFFLTPPAPLPRPQQPFLNGSHPVLRGVWGLGKISGSRP